MCRRAVALYREVRPLVQQGDLWRLVPPAERAALSYVSSGGDAAVVFGFQLADGSADAGSVPLGGLDPDRMYMVTVVDLAAPNAKGESERWRGADLMELGLEWPLVSACTARVWVLEAT